MNTPPSNSLPSSPGPTHDQIAHCARELWEARGRPQDQDVEIWLDAERQVNARGTPAVPATPPPPSPASLNLPASPVAAPVPVAPAVPPASPAGSRKKGAKADVERGTAVAPSRRTGLKKTKLGEETLGEKVERSLNRGGYGQSGDSQLTTS